MKEWVKIIRGEKICTKCGFSYRIPWNVHHPCDGLGKEILVIPVTGETYKKGPILS